MINPSRPDALAELSKTPPKKERRPKRELLVGGCNERCTEPKAALHAFLRAALVDGRVDAVRPFVNTARLVYNGRRLGDGWARQFMEDKLGERRESIDKWLKEWLSWVDRIIDPADRKKPEVGATIVDENQTRVLVRYRHPDFSAAGDGHTSAPVWQLEIRKRGLEWLVSVIDERASEGSDAR